MQKQRSYVLMPSVKFVGSMNKYVTLIRHEVDILQKKKYKENIPSLYDVFENLWKSSSKCTEHNMFKKEKKYFQYTPKYQCLTVISSRMYTVQCSIHDRTV